MDTEFPGTIYQSVNLTTTNYYLSSFDQYMIMKSNVDSLNLIQVGFTLSDSQGNLPQLDTQNQYIWEFNFKDFDVNRDDHAPDSIALLRKQGIDFDKNKDEGIDSKEFAELMMSSGLVCNEYVSWVTFHSAYDFGYLVKILTRRYLPDEMSGFLGVMEVFFGKNVYDLKHMIRFCDNLYGGLERVAKTLKVDRTVGKCHQAGSDSLLTWQAFQKMKELHFTNGAEVMHAGVLYGLELDEF
ncbi:hypothetical protein ACFE04_028427 [Oxalis oulophora]